MKHMKQRELFEPRAPVAQRPRRSTLVPHTIRPELNGPAHVVLRIQRGLPWLRTPKTYRVLERALRNGREKGDFRLIEYSVQRDHLHLVVEAGHRRHLTRGMQGLTIRIAKALNRSWGGRVGRVFADRYFALALSAELPGVSLRRTGSPAWKALAGARSLPSPCGSRTCEGAKRPRRPARRRE